MTVPEICATIAKLEREMKSPPRALAHTLDASRCTDPGCSSCSRRTR
jgi:hypothetical protein